ncbi:dATP/dGTP pyrophosphohydrolase domain-containing protein [Escherichia coli]|uniref:dATP/dGTP pyrophosphohydrolase domain-containing protein n=1 Tax=Escherichia coli TaxID=562 RepID=UPI003D64E032
MAWLLSGGGAKNNVSFDSGNAYADPLREVTPLYTAPPAPVSVPAAMEMDDDFDSAFEHGKAVGWNAYRAAMLQGSQPVSKREQVRREHAEWSDKTFGDVGPVGPLKHLSKEALEAAAEPDDLSEWADMQFLLWDAQRRAGISDAEITAAMEDKLKINMERQWPEPKDGEPRLHIKEPGNSPVTPDGWISCSEQMPSAGEQVLAYRPDAPESNDPLIKMATYVGGSAHGHGFDCYCKPTHWMPLPAAPQEVNRG